MIPSLFIGNVFGCKYQETSVQKCNQVEDYRPQTKRSVDLVNCQHWVLPLTVSLTPTCNSLGFSLSGSPLLEPKARNVAAQILSVTLSKDKGRRRILAWPSGVSIPHSFREVLSHTYFCYRLCVVLLLLTIITIVFLFIDKTRFWKLIIIIKVESLTLYFYCAQFLISFTLL